MRVGRLTVLWVLVRTAVDTLRITVATLYSVRKGTHRREDADRRLRWWANRLLDYAGVRRTVFNPHAIAIEPGRPMIVMCNHASLYDIPLTFVAFAGSIRMLTKQELFNIPIWGKGMEAAEFIAIDRSDHERALHNLELAKQKMSTGICLWVAPEGTRSQDGTLGAFKKGAFMLALQTGALIVPIGIRGAHAVLPTGTFSFEKGRDVEIHVGRVIDAGEYSIDTREQLMRRVRAEIIELADLGTGAAQSRDAALSA